MRVETALARLGWAHLFSGQTLEASTIMTYPSGAMLCTNGNPIESLFVVLSGRVKIYTLSVLHTVETVGPVTCLRIPFDVLRTHNRTIEFTEHLLRGVSEKLFIEANASSNHLMSTLEERLAGYLVSLSESGNELFQDEMSQLKRKEVAEWLGTSYRHLNRTLQAFADEGLVEKTRTQVTILDATRLKERANGMLYE